MDKKEAYQIVLDDLMLCDLFRGKYDAKHGASEHYMYGISTVMEAIACRISEKTGDAFSDIFILNMIKSEEKNEAMSEHTETHEIRTETHGVCSDELISRQAAMDYIGSMNMVDQIDECKDFELNSIDALGENPNEYKPRISMIYRKGEFSDEDIKELERQCEMLLDYTERGESNG